MTLGCLGGAQKYLVEGLDVFHMGCDGELKLGWERGGNGCAAGARYE